LPGEDELSGIDRVDATALCRVASLASVEVLEVASSTMDRAREIAGDPTASLPALVLADRQTHGRGRRGAGWWQAPGSLATSLVLGPEHTGDSGPNPTWSLACGIALAESIRSLAPTVVATVRWPNDVEVAGRKLAGIIVESPSPGRVIFGIGINTSGSAADAPPELRSRVMTLPDLTGQRLPRQTLLEEFVPRLLDLLAAMTRDSDTLGRRYRPLCCLTGEPVRVHVGERIHDGICLGIADDGGLCLATADGTLIVRSGSLAPPGSEWKGPVGP